MPMQVMNWRKNNQGNGCDDSQGYPSGNPSTCRMRVADIGRAHAAETAQAN